MKNTLPHQPPTASRCLPRALAAGLLLLARPGHAQQPASRWVFIGVLTQETVAPCTNPVNTGYRMRWVRQEDAAITRKQLTDSLTQELGRGKYYLTQFYVTSGQPYLIALVAKTRRCASNGQRQEVRSYAFFGGKDQPDLARQLESDQRLYPENSSEFILQLINSGEALRQYQKLLPFVTEEFGGVTGKFMSVTKPGGGAFILAKIFNTTSDQQATVLVKTDDGRFQAEYLQPGEILTKRYDSRQVEIQVVYSPRLAPRPTGLLDFVKDKVRKAVTNDGGTIKTKPVDRGAVTGVRG